MTSEDLEAAERQVFRSVVDTGLWDVMLASVVAMFAIAPLLSSRLGDFWSSAVFVPVWLIVYLAIRGVRERVVVPRIGVVRFGVQRQGRLRRFAVVLVIVNVISLVIAAILATRVAEPGASSFPIAFSVIVLAVFSIAAFAVGIRRIFVYGLLIATAPALGEWLFRQGFAAHHGFPVVYGALSIGIAALGLAKLASIVQKNPPVPAETAAVGNHE